MSAEKIPPQNLEAEQSLLGAILIDKDGLIKIADMVRPEDFYRPAHGEIYQAMLDLFAKREPVDLLSLGNRLSEKSQLESVGGRSYLMELTTVVPTAAHLAHYAGIVQKKASLRRLADAAAGIAEMSFNESDDVETVLDQAEQKLFGVSQKYLKTNFTPIQEALDSAMERIDLLHGNQGELRGLATGFHDLDNLLAGFQRSDLIILAARPSCGKTSLALDIARQAATKHKIKVGIFSLEMSTDQLIDRMLCAESNVDLWRMRTGKLSDPSDSNGDFARIGNAIGTLSEAPIFIDDASNANIMEIRTKARRLQNEHGLDLLVIDYLQLMESRSGNKNSDNRVQEVSEISRGLKNIAKELNIPVLALSQLSRSTEQQKPAIPRLSHLRESGSIEQDADVVMFIYRKAADRNYQPEDIPLDERHIAEIHVAKHRNGPTGMVKLFFDETRACFRNLDKTSRETSFAAVAAPAQLPAQAPVQTQAKQPAPQF